MRCITSITRIIQVFLNGKPKIDGQHSHTESVRCFMYGYTKIKGSRFFEINIERIIVSTYIGGLTLAIANYFAAMAWSFSPYPIMGIGGLIIMILNAQILIFLRKLRMMIDYKNLIIFPTILSVLWGLSSFSFLGASLTDSYFWYSFAASALNFSQPALNTLLYWNVIKRFLRKKPAESPNMEIGDLTESMMKNANNTTYLSNTSL
jgi:hypothetical protein